MTMSVIDKLAPAGFYTLIDPDLGFPAGDCSGSLVRIEEDGRTTYCCDDWGWNGLTWTCAPRRKSWAGRYTRFETIEEARQAFPQYAKDWIDP